ncbi:MAG: hypothetical protein JWQ07_1252 [Ramlibacter sp.]|nr:hypothetical protein [Ramlibacter sp.]
MNDATLMLQVEARKKSGAVAALLNLFLPGAGYMYCGRWFLGVVAFFFTAALLIFSLGFAIVGVVLMLVIDGFLCAGRFNAALIEQALRDGQVAAKGGATATDASAPVGREAPVRSPPLELTVAASVGSAEQSPPVVEPAPASEPLSSVPKRYNAFALAAVGLLVLGVGVGAGVAIVYPGVRDQMQGLFARAVRPQQPLPAAEAAAVAPSILAPLASVTLVPVPSPSGLIENSEPAASVVGAEKSESGERNLDLIESSVTSSDNSSTRLRALPGTDAAVVMVLAPDTPVWVRNEAYSPEQWAQVRLAKDGPYVGWIRNDRLRDFRSEKQ